MHQNNSGRPRLLWVALKLFDKSVDKATWLETAGPLAQRFDVKLVTSYRDTPQQLEAGGRPVEYMPHFGRGIIAKISRRVMLSFAIRNHIKKWKPDVVLIGGDSSPRLLRSVARMQRKYRFSAIYDVRTLPVGTKQARAYNLLADSLGVATKDFAGVTYITEEMRRFCTERFALPAHDSAIWKSGVNPDIFVSKDQPCATQFSIIYHGGVLSRARGLVTLLRAVNLVRDLNVRLYLVSSLREQEVLDEIDALQLTRHVVLLPTVPYTDVPRLINECHVGILPLPACDGWNTSSPIKLFEYLSCGRPVIATPIPAHTKVLQNAPYAFFSDDDSAEGIACAIRRAFLASSDFSSLGLRARQDVLANHTWASQAKVLGDFIATRLAKGQAE